MSRILTKTQAEAIYSAIVAVEKTGCAIGARVCDPDGKLWVLRSSPLAAVVIDYAGSNLGADECYTTLQDFAEAYELNASKACDSTDEPCGYVAEFYGR